MYISIYICIYIYMYIYIYIYVYPHHIPFAYESLVRHQGRNRLLSGGPSTPYVFQWRALAYSTSRRPL